MKGLTVFLRAVILILFIGCASSEGIFRDDYQVESNYDVRIAKDLAIISKATYKSDKNNAQDIRAVLKNLKYFVESDLELKTFQDTPTDTQAIILHSKNYIIFAFRGTDSGTDWLIISEFKDAYGGVHYGFNRAYFSLYNKIQAYFKNVIIPKYKKQNVDPEKIPRYYTGHSLGGALATVAVLIQENSEIKSLGNYSDNAFQNLYTFGSPRVFDKYLGNKFNALFLEKTFRFVNNNDIVTKLPLKANGYIHVGRLIYIDRNGKFTNNETFISKAIDQVKGGIKSFLKLKIDFLDDHSIDQYIKHLNSNQNPFEQQ